MAGPNWVDLVWPAPLPVVEPGPIRPPLSLLGSEPLRPGGRKLGLMEDTPEPDADADASATADAVVRALKLSKRERKRVLKALSRRESASEVDRIACRRGVKIELKSLPKWARGTVPGVRLIRPAEITAAAIKAKCRACGRCGDMID